METNTLKERTFVAIKFDGIQRSLIGEIISRFERASLKIIALKLMIPDETRTRKHYGKDDEWRIRKGQNQINNLIKESILLKSNKEEKLNQNDIDNIFETD